MPMTDDEIRAATVGDIETLGGPIVLVDHDPAWPALYEREAERIRSVLGERVLRIEHVGSTAVPGLAAKPVLDILLAVPDPADEAAYVPSLEAAGYVLRVREPDWHEHRMLKGPDTDVNVHVFAPDSPEIDRMVRFRDRLRSLPAERKHYERAKRDLARRTWTYVQHYADAKSSVIEGILARAEVADDRARILDG